MFQIAGVAPTVRHVATDTALFHQDEKTFGIFRLTSGRIQLTRVLTAGKDVALHTVRPGDLFAEAAIFSKSYDCNAIAVMDSDVLVYSKSKLRRQFKAHPEELWAFTAELAQQVQGLRTAVEMRQIHSAPERVLQTLLLRSDSKGVWKVEDTLKRFAEEVGLTQEALSRALATLKREGRIVKKGKEILIKT